MELRGFFEDGMAFARLKVNGTEIKAMVDTGYDGFLLLPAANINELKLPHLFKTVYMTADGNTHEGRVYQGQIEWLDQRKMVPIDSTNGNFALVGMKLLKPLRLSMEPSKDLLLLSSET